MKGYEGLGRGRTPGRQYPHSTEVIVGTQGTEVTVVTASWASRGPRESNGRLGRDSGPIKRYWKWGSLVQLLEEMWVLPKGPFGLNWADN